MHELELVRTLRRTFDRAECRITEPEYSPLHGFYPPIQPRPQEGELTITFRISSREERDQILRALREK